ncbi:hypothetical protein, partial [uncultured Hymenobacter sp.]|uniref:hypothetical protein n=1 Tax=uncultured Hymenobacter sp. TaxID=170016 RepID=UPI0035C9CA22
MTLPEPIPPFSIYSPLDAPIIALSNQYRVPLIGGTALEMLVRHYRLPVERPRSINDIDFVCFRQPRANRAGFRLALLHLGLKIRDENPFSIHFATDEVVYASLNRKPVWSRERRTF